MSTTIGWDDAFYAHYHPFVRAYISRRVPSDVVDDLVAQVFEIAWRRRAAVPQSALPWLYRTARNVVGDRYRADARFKQLAWKLKQVPSEMPVNPGDVVSERELLLGAMRMLDDSDRELLLLIAWEGLTVQAAALSLEISPGTASVRLHRARQRLEQHIQNDDESSREI